MIKKIFLTADGLKEKEEEQRALKSSRVEAVKELVFARNMGDLSENGAYKAARFRLSGIDRRLRYLDNILRRVEVKEKRTDGRVGIGTKVTVHNGEKEMDLLLVDGHESDFMRGKISLYSPIGKALMGKKVGDTVEVVTVSGKVEYVISAIS